MARACKRSRLASKSQESLSVCSSDSVAAARSGRAVDDQLQLASAWLPGRIAGSHAQVVAKHLIKAVAGLAKSCGLMSDPASELTAQLGDIWWRSVFSHLDFLFVFTLVTACVSSQCVRADWIVQGHVRPALRQRQQIQPGNDLLAQAEGMA